MTESGFVAPYAGTYAFTFSASTAINKYGNFYMRVRKNGALDFEIHDRNGEDDANNVSYSWLTTLQRGDKIDFYIYSHSLRSHPLLPVTFTGQLIHM